MAKYQVHFMGWTEVDASDKESARQKATDKLGMEDDIFTISAVHNIIEAFTDDNVKLSHRGVTQCTQSVVAAGPGEGVELHFEDEIRVNGLFHHRSARWMFVADVVNGKERIYIVKPLDSKVILSFDKGDAFITAPLVKLTCL